MNEVDMSPEVIFFQRQFPSANMILLKGSRPVLFDSGFGGDIEETVQLLRDAGIEPQALQIIVNSHFHCDHAGGNHIMQSRYGVPIAAHRWEAAMINRRDSEACSINYLVQPIDPYTVDHMLKDGDIISTGDTDYQVIHTPGHTTGHISLYADGILFAGDTIHADDVAWMNPFREGASAIYRMLDTLDQLAQLPLKVIYSGHGAANHDPMGSIDRARKRYEKWSQHPEKVGWHASKRIFAYALMLYDGLTMDEIPSYLLNCPWFTDYSKFIFQRTPESFVQPLIDELLRSGAATWRDGKLMANAPHAVPKRTWLDQTTSPSNWNNP